MWQARIPKLGTMAAHALMPTQEFFKPLVHEASLVVPIPILLTKTSRFL